MITQDPKFWGVLPHLDNQAPPPNPEAQYPVPRTLKHNLHRHTPCKRANFMDRLLLCTPVQRRKSTCAGTPPTSAAGLRQAGGAPCGLLPPGIPAAGLHRGPPRPGRCPAGPPASGGFWGRFPNLGVPAAGCSAGSGSSLAYRKALQVRLSDPPLTLDPRFHILAMNQLRLPRQDYDVSLRSAANHDLALLQIQLQLQPPSETPHAARLP